MNIKSTKAFDIAASMTTTLGKLVAEPLDDGGREAGGDQAPLHVGPVLGGGPLPGGPADREPGKGRGGGDAPLDLGHLGRLLRPISGLGLNGPTSSFGSCRAPSR